LNPLSIVVWQKLPERGCSTPDTVFVKSALQTQLFEFHDYLKATKFTNGTAELEEL